jgi:hypothetical protein
MANKPALAEVSERTCAVGILEGTPEDFALDPTCFRILGTGFVIHPQIVMTNRHVLYEVLHQNSKEPAYAEQTCVSFLRPKGAAFQFNFLWVHAIAPVEHPRSIDIGLIKLLGPVTDLSPVRFAEYFHQEVGDSCAVCGYAYGRELHRRPSETQYRFGPILQRGFVSAIAPYDNADRIDRVLLDVRTAQGMSGSPIFDPETGAVFAIHDAGDKGNVVAFGVPLSRRVVDKYVTAALTASAPWKLETEFVRRRPRPVGS